MTKLTISPPSTGELNTVAEPKVTTALQAIETWANGNVGTNNIGAETVTEAMLVSAAKTLLNAKALGLTLKVYSTSQTAVSGELLNMSKTTTVTLPTAALNRVVGVFAGIASGEEVKVKTNGGLIYGDFVVGSAEVVLLAQQHVLLQNNGTDWVIVSGESKRTQTYSAQVVAGKATAEAGIEPSATRPALVTAQTTIAGTAELFVGAVLLGGYTNTEPVTFFVPPGVKWKINQQVGYSSILL